MRVDAIQMWHKFSLSKCSSVCKFPSLQIRYYKCMRNGLIYILYFWSYFQRQYCTNRHQHTQLPTAEVYNISTDLSCAPLVWVRIKFSSFFWHFFGDRERILARQLLRNEKFLVTGNDSERNWFNWIFTHYANCHLCRWWSRSLLSFPQREWLSVLGWNVPLRLMANRVLCGLYTWKRKVINFFFQQINDRKS